MASVLGTAAVTQAGDAGIEVNSIYSELNKASGTVKTRLGEDGTTLDTVLLATHSTAAVNGWRLKFSGTELRFDYANGGSAIAYRITGNTTAEQFGTGTALPYAFYAPNLVVGDTIGNARRMSNGTAAPTTERMGRAKIRLNRAPASGQPMGWVCSAAEHRGRGCRWRTSHERSPFQAGPLLVVKCPSSRRDEPVQNHPWIGSDLPDRPTCMPMTLSTQCGHVNPR